MQRCFLLTVFALFLVSCSSPTATPTPLPQATYTPLPTYTPYPTFTPVSQPTAQITARPISTATPKPTVPAQSTASASTSSSSSSSSSSCIAWTDAEAHMNETSCVRGTVYSATQNGSTFFINFDNTRTSFYAVSFNYTWDNLKNKCVEISGKIAPYNGRTEIVIDKQEQLKMCQ